MRWSSWVSISAPPAGGPPAPSTIRSSPSTATRTPQPARPAAIAGEAVAFLDPQLGEAAHHRAAAGAGRGDGEDRVFVDHRRRPLRRECRRRSACRRGHADRRPARRPPRARFSKAMSAPISRRHSSRPVRSGLSPTPSIVTSEPGTISAATSGKAAEDGSPGTTIGAAASSGWPSTVMRRPPPSLGLGRDRARRNGASMRSVWSRVGCGSITVVAPGRVEPGEQHRRFDLRRGHRQTIARSGSDWRRR